MAGDISMDKANRTKTFRLLFSEPKQQMLILMKFLVTVCYLLLQYQKKWHLAHQV